MTKATGYFIRILTLLSAAAFVACGILWARSYRVSDLFLRQNASVSEDGAIRTRQYGIFTAPAELALYSSYATSVGATGSHPLHGWFHVICPRTDLPTLIAGIDLSPRYLGFGVARPFWGDGSFCLIVPVWAALIVTGILPARGVLTMRRAVVARRRRALGLCPACGYDLRASPDRCPECGAAALQN